MWIIFLVLAAQYTLCLSSCRDFLDAYTSCYYGGYTNVGDPIYKRMLSSRFYRNLLLKEDNIDSAFESVKPMISFLNDCNNDVTTLRCGCLKYYNTQVYPMLKWYTVFTSQVSLAYLKSLLQDMELNLHRINPIDSFTYYSDPLSYFCSKYSWNTEKLSYYYETSQLTYNDRIFQDCYYLYLNKAPVRNTLTNNFDMEQVDVETFDKIIRCMTCAYSDLKLNSVKSLILLEYILLKPKIASSNIETYMNDILNMQQIRKTSYNGNSFNCEINLLQSNLDYESSACQSTIEYFRNNSCNNDQNCLSEYYTCACSSDYDGNNWMLRSFSCDDPMCMSQSQTVCYNVIYSNFIKINCHCPNKPEREMLTSTTTQSKIENNEDQSNNNSIISPTGANLLIVKSVTKLPPYLIYVATLLPSVVALALAVVGIVLAIKFCRRQPKPVTGSAKPNNYVESKNDNPANQNEKKLEDESPYENLNNFGFPINSSNRNSISGGNPYVCIEQYLGSERKEGFNESES